MNTRLQLREEETRHPRSSSRRCPLPILLLRRLLPLLLLHLRRLPPLASLLPP